MATILDVRTCPYCGVKLILGDLPIVATQLRRSASGTAHGAVNVGDMQTEEMPTPASGAPTLRMLGRWPVIGEPPSSRIPLDKSGLWSRRKSPPLLPDVNQEGRSEDLPARICTNPECYQPLPTDVDDRKLITIAVVGMHGASKTHFLATSLYQAYHDRGLDLALECSEFYPDEPSSKSLYVNYFERLLETERVLPKTQLELMTDVRSHPLVCRATFGAGPPVALLFHDVAGEVFVDQGLRNQYTSFLRRADGIIFIIDPLRLRPIRKSSSQMFGVRPSQAEMSQTDLVRAVIDDLRGRDLSRLPVAVAVSKSDLLTAALGTHFMFAQDPPVERDAWMANIYDVDAEMRSLLAQRLDAADLVAATRPFRNVTFHAVAPLGMQPVVTIHAGMPSPPSSFSGGSLDGAAAIVDMPGVESQAEVKNIRPRRCLDPLVSILSRLPNLSV